MASCNNCGHTALLGYYDCEICNFVICNDCNNKEYNKEYLGFYVIDIAENELWICSNNCMLKNLQYINNDKQFNNLKKQQQTIQDQIEKELMRPLLRQHMINDLLNIVNEYIFAE